MSVAPQQHRLVRTCERGEDEETTEQRLCIYVVISISMLYMSRCIQSQLYIQDKVDGELCFKFLTGHLNLSMKKAHLSLETHTPLICIARNFYSTMADHKPWNRRMTRSWTILDKGNGFTDHVQTP